MELDTRTQETYFSGRKGIWCESRYVGGLSQFVKRTSLGQYSHLPITNGTLAVRHVKLCLRLQ